MEVNGKKRMNREEQHKFAEYAKKAGATKKEFGRSANIIPTRHKFSTKRMVCRCWRNPIPQDIGTLSAYLCQRFEKCRRTCEKTFFKKDNRRKRSKEVCRGAMVKSHFGLRHGILSWFPPKREVQDGYVAWRSNGLGTWNNH